MVMFMDSRYLRFGTPRFSIPDRSGHLFRHARRHPWPTPSRPAPIDARRLSDELGEATAEGPQRRAADRETDLGDTEVAATQECHRSLDASRHQVAVGRLAVRQLELAAEVPCRHVHAAGERLDVQRLRVLTVDPVADPAQEREVAEALRRGGVAGHLRDRATSFRPCLVQIRCLHRRSGLTGAGATLLVPRPHSQPPDTFDLLRQALEGSVQPCPKKGNSWMPRITWSCPS